MGVSLNWKTVWDRRRRVTLPWTFRRKELITLGLCLGVCAILLGALPLYSYLKYGLLTYEDDAYYYFVIARNIHSLGLSTFDQQTLTNGYQPLWLGALLLEYALCGSFDYTLIIELALLLGALALLLAAQRNRSPLRSAVLSLTFVVAVAGFTVNGMETALLIFCLSALFFALERLDAANTRHAIAIGAIGALAIGARIDAGVFILPLILLAMRSWRGRLIALGVIGVGGLLYMVANQAIFGSPVPISGDIKSLGGLQFNRHLFEDFIAQLFEPNALQSAGCIIDSACGNSDYFRVVLLIPLAAGLLLFARPAGFARDLLLAFLIGIMAYAAKLFLMSSWSIWPWYFFPVFLGSYGALKAGFQLLDRAQDGVRYYGWRAAALALPTLLVAVPVHSYVMAPPAYDWQGFGVINQRAIARYGALLDGARVAMGDRAGSFAFNYKGPVTQLEGLVEDRSYLDLVKSGGDLKARLCQMGVKYLIGYADKLGNYRSYKLPALRPWLTSFRGPSLTVSKSDEVGRVFDLAIFDSKDLGDEGDSYLYIWRLTGCPPDSQSVALDSPPRH
jgi:hypothetical protein